MLCAAALPMATGDVADTAAAVSAAFQLLVECFWRVVWVPGNHCLWLRGDTRDSSIYPDSWAKLMALRQVRKRVLQLEWECSHNCHIALVVCVQMCRGPEMRRRLGL